MPCGMVEREAGPPSEQAPDPSFENEKTNPLTVVFPARGGLGAAPQPAPAAHRASRADTVRILRRHHSRFYTLLVKLSVILLTVYQYISTPPFAFWQRSPLGGITSTVRMLSLSSQSKISLRFAFAR